MDADAEGDGEAGGGKLFEHLEVDLVRLVPTAVGGVVREAEQARLGEQGEEFAWEVARFLLLGRFGDDLPLGDVAYEGDEVLGLLGGQLTFHRVRGAVGHGGALLFVGHYGGRARRAATTPTGVRGVPGRQFHPVDAALPGRGRS